MDWRDLGPVSFAAVAVLCSAVFLAPAQALALAAHQNKSYDNPVAHEKWLVVSLGDSIAAGFCGINCTQKAYAEYMSYLNADSTTFSENVDIDLRIQAHSGHVAAKISADIDKHQDSIAQADVVLVEACGNDYLAARKEFQKKGSASFCKRAALDAALNACRKGISDILDKLVTYAKPKGRIRVMNIYYPGLARDESIVCPNGVKSSEAMLATIAEGNWYTCEQARLRGIPCADAFAEFNASDAHRSLVAWVGGETLESYRQRLTRTHRDKVTDPTVKRTQTGIISLLIGDNTHPNQAGHSRLGRAHHDLGYEF